MATQAQIAANRRNSQKSTGPRSEAGKAAAAQNATRTGLYAHSILIDGEDPAELDTLAHDYLETCRPVGPRERAIVDSLIHTDWLLRRMRRLETEDVNSEFDHLRKTRGDEFDETYGMTTVYIRLADRIDRIQRRVTTLERLYHRRLVDLERLQSNRPPAPEPQPAPPRAPEPGPDPVALPDPSPLPGIGFVSSESPETREDAAQTRATAPSPHGDTPPQCLRPPIPVVSTK